MHDIDYSEPVPLFPLPQCILLPHATIPLNIFEPRYISMTSDTLEDRSYLAMATLTTPHDPEAAVHEPNQPAIKRGVCLGEIVRHRRLPDGRYHLLLRGLERCRIVSEIVSDDTPYRLAHIEPMEPDDEALEIDLADHRRRLDALLRDPALADLASVAQVRQWATDSLPTDALVDLVTLTVCRNSEERYASLTQPNAARRASLLNQHLMHTRHTLRVASRMNSPLTDDGLCLN